MSVKRDIQQFEYTIENLERTLSEITNIFEFDLTAPITDDDEFNIEKTEILDQYNKLKEYQSTLSEVKTENVDYLCDSLDSIVDAALSFDLKAGNKLNDLILNWKLHEPAPWYLKGKILFQLFVERAVDDLDGIIEIFLHVIEMSENVLKYKELTFWSYSLLGNLYLYRILTGEEALEHALKYYNQAYRFAKMNDIKVEDSFIFDNIEILQHIIMNQYPLLAVIYNSVGIKIYEYLFQFIEVIAEDKRFIPNFTALLSAVDDRIDELFKSPISNSYIVINNRLMVLSTLYDDKEKNWVKVAMVFSYLQQSADSIVIDQLLVDKVKKFNTAIMEEDVLKNYIIRFDGRYDHTLESMIEERLLHTFSENQM